MKPELTSKEKKAIERLQKVFKNWPESLWLFNNGTMCVMKKNKQGERVFTKSGGVDSNYCIDTIDNIHSEGGDW